MPRRSAEATDSKFQIQVFAAGEIVPGLQIVDAVQNGTVEIGHTASYYYFGKDPTFAFGTSVPFGPNARMQPGLVHARRRQGSAERVLQEIQRPSRLLAGNTGCQMGGWFRKEINTRRRSQGSEDADRRFRRPRAGRSSAWCRSRSPAATSIRRWRRARIDAAEWVGPYDDEKLGFYKVAPHYYYPGWWEGGAMLHAFVNLDKWNELPKHYQAILEQAGHYANTWMMAKYDELNPAGAARLLAGGAKLHAFSPAIMEAAQGGRWNCTPRSPRSNASFKKVYDSMMAFTQERVSVVPGRGTYLRQLHDPHDARLSANGRVPMQAPGFSTVPGPVHLKSMRRQIDPASECRS